MSADPKRADRSDADFVATPGVLPLRWHGGAAPAVELADFGMGPLEGVFYDDALRAFRRLAGGPPETRRVPVALLDSAMPFEDAIPLVGFVFHVSRTGSSLVVRLLASDPSTVVVSESSAIDDVVMGGYEGEPSGARASRVEELRRVVALHARARTATSARVVVKLDAWHLADVELFREAFPTTPCVVVVREPAQVIASQRERRARFVVPGLVDWARLGVRVEDVPPSDLDGFAVRVFAAIYAGAARLAAEAGCEVVRYDQLPEAAWQRIAPMFGIPAGPDTTDAELTTQHAKDRWSRFDPALDHARLAKLEATEPALCARIADELDPLYASLL